MVLREKGCQFFILGSLNKKLKIFKSKIFYCVVMTSRRQVTVHVNPRSDESSCKNCLSCLSCPLSLCMIGVSIFYTYYGIDMLWENRYMYADNPCSISHLWQLVLVNVVFAGLGIFGTLKNCCGEKNKDEKDPNVLICALCLGIFILVGIVTWELVELYGIPNRDFLNITDIDFNMTNVNTTACKELMNTNIWSFEQVTSAIHLAALAVLVIVACIMGCIGCFVG